MTEDAAGIEATPSEQVRPVVYDCTSWSGESRRLLASLLETKGLASAWQGTEVTVFSADIAIVDELVDEVEAAARTVIDPEAATIVYEVSGWPDALQNEFTSQLTISEVPYSWDENGDVIVNEEDEQLVEEVLDLLPDADEVDDDVDGLQVQELLNELFMACDRLASKPSDEAAVADLRRISGVLDSVPAAFGFEERAWLELVGAAAEASAADLATKDRSKRAKAVLKIVRQYI